MKTGLIYEEIFLEHMSDYVYTKVEIISIMSNLQTVI